MRNDLCAGLCEANIWQVRFELDDLEEEWTFREKFDYIHSRDLVTAVKDWPHYLKQMYKFTQPGGYVEISGIVT